MKKSTFQSLAFDALFNSNNIERKKRGLSPINFNPKDRHLGWAHYDDLRKNTLCHIDALYKKLEPFLQDEPSRDSGQ